MNLMHFSIISASILSVLVTTQTFASITDTERLKNQNIENFRLLERELVQYQNNAAIPEASKVEAGKLVSQLAEACTGNNISSQGCADAIPQIRTNFEGVKTSQAQARQADDMQTINEKGLEKVLEPLQLALNNPQTTQDQKLRIAPVLKAIAQSCTGIDPQTNEQTRTTNTKACSEAINQALEVQAWLTSNKTSTAKRMQQRVELRPLKEGRIGTPARKKPM